MLSCFGKNGKMSWDPLGVAISGKTPPRHRGSSGERSTDRREDGREERTGEKRGRERSAQSIEGWKEISRQYCAENTHLNINCIENNSTDNSSRL